MGDEFTVPDRTSPVLMRRWLGNELERLRREAGLTQRQAASELGWGLSKVGYVESGERPLSVADLEKRVLPTYDVPQEMRPRLIQMAIAANAKAWWDEYSDADVSRDWKTYIGIEQGASAMRSFESGIVPGLLQTRDYAFAAISTVLTGTMPAERAASVAEVRLRRQRVLFEGREPLGLWAVLDEAVLRRPAGGAAVMRDQLNHVADVAEERPNVTVQVIELSAGVHAAALGPFTLLSFPWPTDPGVVYLETRLVRARTFDRREQIYSYSQLFDRLTGFALPPDDSVKLLRQLAGEYGARAQ